ncbi:MAG: hypothetical protein U0232_17305 [Thermomicrobiales bacterium]
MSGATGLPGKSTLLTNQSSPFFSVPGTPWAYSGLEISSPSAALTRRRSSRSGRGKQRALAVEVGVEEGQAAKPFVDGDRHVSGGQRDRHAQKCAVR